MKTANFFTFLLLAAALTVTVSGCKKNLKSPTPIFSRQGTAPGGNNPGGIENAAPTVPAGTDPSVTSLPRNPDGTTPLGMRPGLDDYHQDREAFRQNTVYFDFDKYNVKPSELNKAQDVASYLKGQPNDAVLIEGHCDERGTPEYNRALGERRALSVRESLINLGVAGDRVHTTSYGEDRPAEMGHNEAAYGRNRRGEFILLKPKAGTTPSETR